MKIFRGKLFGITFSIRNNSFCQLKSGMTMKKFYLITLVVSLILLASCASNNSGYEKSMNINLKEIKQITVSTQTTEEKQDVVVENEKVDELIKKLNSYSIRETKAEKEKGWQYLFKIEKKEGGIILISFMEDRVTMDETVYEVEGYDSNDFSYLFK